MTCLWEPKPCGEAFILNNDLPGLQQHLQHMPPAKSESERWHRDWDVNRSLLRLAVDLNRIRIVKFLFARAGYLAYGGIPIVDFVWLEQHSIRSPRMLKLLLKLSCSLITVEKRGSDTLNCSVLKRAALTSLCRPQLACVLLEHLCLGWPDLFAEDPSFLVDLFDSCASDTRSSVLLPLPDSVLAAVPSAQWQVLFDSAAFQRAVKEQGRKLHVRALLAAGKALTAPPGGTRPFNAGTASVCDQYTNLRNVFLRRAAATLWAPHKRRVRAMFEGSEEEEEEEHVRKRPTMDEHSL